MFVVGCLHFVVIVTNTRMQQLPLDAGFIGSLLFVVLMRPCHFRFLRGFSLSLSLSSFFLNPPHFVTFTTLSLLFFSATPTSFVCARIQITAPLSKFSLFLCECVLVTGRRRPSSLLSSFSSTFRTRRHLLSDALQSPTLAALTSDPYASIVLFKIPTLSFLLKYDSQSTL
jgi:hypothetical protein